MRTGREAGILFWYRTSPKQMLPHAYFAEGVSNGRVTDGDPPPFRVGEIGVWLTSRGRLIRLEVVPPQLEQVSGPAPAVSWALFAAGLARLLYVALEPYVRSRWPHTIITWSRLSSGRIRDVLVGRDLLLGMLFGVVQSTLVWSGIAITRRFGAVEPIPLMPVLDPLLSTRFVFTSFINFLYSSITAALAFFVLLFLLRQLLRKDWLALAVFLLIAAVAGASGQDLPLVAGAMSLMAATVAVTALLRFGLVTYAVSNFVASVLTVGFPLSVDPARWYSSPSAFAVVALGAAAVYGYHLASGGWRVRAERAR
jgi:serine/threonine-protein kinase